MLTRGRQGFLRHGGAIAERFAQAAPAPSLLRAFRQSHDARGGYGAGLIGFEFAIACFKKPSKRARFNSLVTAAKSVAKASRS